MQTIYQIPEYFLDLLELSSVNTRLEIDFLTKVFAAYQVEKVLDVACGVGRHSIPLAQNDYHVVGFDYSSFQIEKARQLLKNKDDLPVEFYKKNANNFSFDQEFDAAICMWSTLGEEPLNYHKVIKNVYKALAFNGIFVVDNKDWQSQPGEDKVKEDRLVKKDLTIERFLRDRFTQNFRVRETILSINNQVFDNFCLTRTFSTDRWCQALEKGGFTIKQVYYDYKKNKKTQENPQRVQIVAQKS